MNRAFLIVLALLCDGCSDSEKLAAGIKGFIESCDGPVSGRLTASTYNNQIELSCSNFKPAKSIAQQAKGEKQ